MRKVWSFIRTTLIIILTIVLFFFVYQTSVFFIRDGAERKAITQVKELIHDNIDDQAQEFSFTHDAWNTLHAINPDMTAYIAFPDEFISEPIVCSTDGDYYLKHWIDGTNNTQGTIFTTNDGWKNNCMNTVLYGHNVYYDASAKFTPLTILTEQALYDQHSAFKIWTEDKAYTYHIYSVIEYDASLENFNLLKQIDMDQETFDKFKTEVDSKNMIVPSCDIQYGDKFVTLLTCKKYQKTARIVVTAKLISEEGY